MTVVVDIKEVNGDDEFTGSVYPTDTDLEQVRAGFNPSQDPGVRTIKLLSAALLRAIDVHGHDPRTTAIAKTTVEEASMWGVKSATALPF